MSVPISISETDCENVWNGRLCHWPLVDVEIRIGGQPTRPPAAPKPSPAPPRCVNGHEIAVGDELCFVCGADPATDEPVPAPLPEPEREITIIDGWEALHR